MKLRLIGIGDKGDECVKRCVEYFVDTARVGFLLESVSIVKFTTPAFANAMVALYPILQSQIRFPIHESWLREGLAYILFGGPIDEADVRRQELLDQPITDTHGSYRAYWASLVINPEFEQEFDQIMQDAINDHRNLLSSRQWKGGDDWLVLPRNPIVANEYVARRANIGRGLMSAALDNGGFERLVQGIGTPSGPDVDIVAIVFSASDSFGGDGAEYLAEQIRNSLKGNYAMRVVALLGFAVMEDIDASIDGRMVCRYVGATPNKGAFDGMIARYDPADFPPLLAAISMASDSSVTQVDNPDSNQLQRDFGRRMVAAGYATCAPGPMNLSTLFDLAWADLLENHSTPEPTRIAVDLTNQLKTVLNNAEPPEWVSHLSHRKRATNEATAGSRNEVPGPTRIEATTARKVIAYVGHNGHLSAEQITKLRERIAKMFPRARTVVYKYNVNLIHRTALQRGHGLFGIFAPRQQPGNEANIELAAGLAHFGLFVVDGFQEATFHRLSEFLRCHFRFRKGGKSVTFQTSAKWVRRIVEVLVARSLVSVPFPLGKDLSADWEPQGKSQQFRHAVRDGVIGLLDENFQKAVYESIEPYVVGETADELGVAEECFQAADTIGIGDSFLREDGVDLLLSPADLADVLVGLNVICNEKLEARQCEADFITCLREVLEHATQDDEPPF